jgi:predicted phosphodiesterase
MLTVGVLSDVHLNDSADATAAWHNAYDFAGVPRRLHRAAAAFQSAGVDLVCLIGDLAHHGSPGALRPLADALSSLDAPTLLVAGNHDAGGHEKLVAALPGVESATGAGQLHGDWRVAGVQVAPGGWFGARALDLLDTSAWDEDPVLLLSHFPVLSHAQRLAERGMPYPGDLIDRPAIAQALTARTAPTVVISGHIHARDASCSGSVLQLVQGALVEAPYECSILGLSCDAVTRRSIELGGPPATGLTPALSELEDRHILESGRWRVDHLRPAVRVTSTAPLADAGVGGLPVNWLSS